MTSKKANFTIQFLTGFPIRSHRDELGNVISSEKQEQTIGLQIDDNFYYFNSKLLKIVHCSMKNAKKKSFYSYTPTDSVHPELQKLFFETLKKNIEIRKDPDWFKCRFALVGIKTVPEFDYDATPVYSEKFVIVERNFIHELNSSGIYERNYFKKSCMTILQEFEKGEIPQGELQSADFLLKLNNDIEQEKETLFCWEKILKEYQGESYANENQAF